MTDSPNSTNTSENSQPDQWAALQWEPWVKMEGAWEPPSNDLWVDPLLVTIRVAFAMMFVPKDRMMELWRDDADLMIETIGNLAVAKGSLEAALTVVDAATARLLAAAVDVERGTIE